MCVCVCIHVNFLPFHCKFLSVNSLSNLALFFLCGAIEAAAGLSFGLAEVRPRQSKGATMQGHAPQAAGGMEPQAGVQRDACRVLEMGRLKRD